jgi:hypothetical protein
MRCIEVVPVSFFGIVRLLVGQFFTVMAHYSFQVDYLIVGSRLVVSVQCLEFFEVLNNAGGKAMLVRPFEYVVSTFADRGGIVSADLRVFLRRPVVIVQHGEGVSVISRRSFRESF